MKSVKYGDSYIYIDDEIVDEKNTGIAIMDNNMHEISKDSIKKSEEDFLSDTMTNIFGDKDE